MPVLSSGGQRLHFELIDNPAPWGTDPYTILFHHGIGTDSGIWAKWIGSFVDRYRIVRFDMRGFAVLCSKRHHAPPSPP
jgi:pimeloyl-ACP methyl ester carboxylesterase